MDKEYYGDWLGYYSSGTAVTDAAGSVGNILIIVKDVTDKIKEERLSLFGKARRSSTSTTVVPSAFKLSKTAVGDAIAAYSERTTENIRKL